jgi:hypothetical protein
MNKNTRERLMARVVVCQHGLDCHNCCWFWTGGTDHWGYGKVMYQGKQMAAHRALYQVSHGIVLSPHVYILHTCDIRLCCNLAHVYPGDHQKNMDDRKERGRTRNGYRPKGSEQSQSVLNKSKVLQARRLWYSGYNSKRGLGKLFHVSTGVMGRVLARTDWSHVQGELLVK